MSGDDDDEFVPAAKREAGTFALTYGESAPATAPLAKTIADPFWTADNPLYVVGRTSEKRSHYVRATKEWASAESLCGQLAGELTKWNGRESMKNVCQACHAAACRMPCVVKKVPDDYFNRPWVKGTRGFHR